MNSAQRQQEQRDYALLHKPGNRPPKPTGRGVLIVDVFIDPLMGWLRAGTEVEIHGDCIGGWAVCCWRRQTVNYYGLVVNALELVEPVEVPELELVR